MRKLATVRVVSEIETIPGAENIELVKIDGWQCVAKKGEFNAGDKCAYFEIDSILPNVDVFSFMQPRKFRVKTIKLMKKVSQGLALPLESLSQFGVSKDFPVGQDLTDMIGVKKHDPEGEAENSSPSPEKPWYWSLPIIRRLFKKKSGNFPVHITQKTDEERMQNLSSKSLSEFATGSYAITEKLDGTSTTFIFRTRPWWSRWLLGDEFLVCSRNLTKVHEDGSYWWTIAKQENILKTMKKIHSEHCRTDQYLIIQGETIGQSIQGNKYARNGLEFRVFNMKKHSDKHGTVSYDYHESQKIIDEMQLTIQMVPLLYSGSHDSLADDPGESMLNRVSQMASVNKSILNGKTMMEGVVVRSIGKPKSSLVSFKYINPNFLLKHE